MLKKLAYVILGACAAFTIFVMGFWFLLTGFRPEDPSVHYYRGLWKKQAAEPQTPRWFPDGQRIAFSYKGGVYVVDSAGSQVQLIDGGGSELDLAYGPSVSPDGSRIAYTAYKQPGGLFGDKSEGWRGFTANADGTDQRRITEVASGDHARSPDWSGIAFLGPGYWEISVMNANGSGLRTITAPPGGWGDVDGELVWSPQGGHIAFTGYESNVPDSHYIYVVGNDGSDLTELGDGRVASSPAWSPDGDRIAHLLEDDGPPKLYIVRLNSGDALEVADPGLEPETYRHFWGNVQWFRGGSQILFIAIQRGGPVDECGRGEQKSYFPFVVNSDGSGIRSLGEWPVHAASPSPDGSRIAALISERSGFVLYTIAPDGSDPRLLVELDGSGNPSPAHGRPIDSVW